jgi:hypothetical protein
MESEVIDLGREVQETKLRNQTWSAGTKYSAGTKCSAGT